MALDKSKEPLELSPSIGPIVVQARHPLSTVGTDSPAAVIERALGNVVDELMGAGAAGGQFPADTPRAEVRSSAVSARLALCWRPHWGPRRETCHEGVYDGDNTSEVLSHEGL